MRVIVDHDRGEAYGRCFAVAPALFDVDDDGYSVIEVNTGAEFKGRMSTTDIDIPSEIISEVFLKSLWQSEDTASHELGYGNLASWQTTIDTAAQYSVIPQSFDAADLVVELPSSIQ